MTKTDIVDIAAAYNRLRLTVADLFGQGIISESVTRHSQRDLKDALLQDGSKKGLDRILILVNTLFRQDDITHRHHKNLVRDIETLRKAEF